MIAPRATGWLLLALAVPPPAFAQEEEAAPATTAWQVDCAATTVIVERKMVPASTCAAVQTLPMEAGGATLKLWTEARNASQAVVRAPAVGFEFPVPEDRAEVLNARFAGNAAAMAGSTLYRLDFNDAPPIEGRCDRLVVPPARAAGTGAAGPRPVSIARLGCQVDDVDGTLRHQLDARGIVTVSVTVVGIRMVASFPLDGLAGAYDAADARLNGRPAPVAAPSPPAPPGEIDFEDLEIEPPSTTGRHGR